MADTFKQDDDETSVMFRRWRNKQHEIFAIIPSEEWDRRGSVTVFDGCHCGGNYQACIRGSRPATPEEYAPLKRSMESAPYGYRVRVIKRRGTR
ncbi:hypothetical protein T8K17_11320 [Thalassobaculum sp. OXR-137]|uniref:hypothetical protein n=1 Tax=Thalassobaculum sp. OXR-137 TaxID=3100173 RepID=UPI002AC93BA0|nr:hypothetical protein [Thalassobaculum sp. OXR-137]WPZ36725.1 hypothetical protein T8K17_11320 [Thalassobaculum sp. OXR-137]